MYSLAKQCLFENDFEQKEEQKYINHLPYSIDELKWLEQRDEKEVHPMAYVFKDNSFGY